MHTQMCASTRTDPGARRRRNAALESERGSWPSSPAHCTGPDRPKRVLKPAPSGQPRRAAVRVLMARAPTSTRHRLRTERCPPRTCSTNEKTSTLEETVQRQQEVPPKTARRHRTTPPPPIPGGGPSHLQHEGQHRDEDARALREPRQSAHTVHAQGVEAGGGDQPGSMGKQG